MPSLQLDRVKNLVCIYRADQGACTCEPWPMFNMAENFFEHLKRRKALTRSGEISVKDDILSFGDGARHHYIRGWEPLLPSLRKGTVLSLQAMSLDFRS